MTLTFAHNAGAVPVFNRRLSVPINNYGFPPAPQFLSAESQMLQAYPQMAGNQCQQYMGQSFDPSPLAPRPQDPLTLAIPPSVGGSSPGPHSTSSNNTPWYTPASSPQPSQRLSPGFIPVSFRQRVIEMWIDLQCGLGRVPLSTLRSSRWRYGPHSEAEHTFPTLPTRWRPTGLADVGEWTGFEVPREPFFEHVD